MTKDHRIEFAMTQPRPPVGVTFTQLSQWVWRVNRDGEWIGTINGDSVIGFTARDIDYASIGRGYDSAEAALQAWAPAMDSHPDVSNGLSPSCERPDPGARNGFEGAASATSGD